MRSVLLVALAAALGWGAQDEGAQAMREGRFADAERIYRQSLRESPKDPRIRFNLALALHSGGKYREAIAELDQFLAAVPRPGPAHLIQGLARLKLNEHCEAIAPLEQARRWQSSEQVLTELGDAAAGCKRYGQAAEAYREAWNLTPADRRLARAAARSFWQARDYSQARPLYEALREESASDPEYLFEYGDTLARLEGGAAGLSYLEKAVAAAPELVPARGALGRVLVELDRAALAIPHLEAAVTVDPALLLPLSRAYRSVGRREEAARAEAAYKQSLSQRQ